MHHHPSCPLLCWECVGAALTGICSIHASKRRAMTSCTAAQLSLFPGTSVAACVSAVSTVILTGESCELRWCIRSHALHALRAACCLLRIGWNSLWSRNLLSKAKTFALPFSHCSCLTPAPSLQLPHCSAPNATLPRRFCHCDSPTANLSLQISQFKSLAADPSLQLSHCSLC